MKKFTFLMGVVFALFLSSAVLAQTVVFSEDFEDQQASTRFTKVELGSSNVVNLAFPYGSMTPAPNGGKYCMKIAVNTSEGAASFAGLFPKGLKLSGNYTLTFNAWFNWTGSSKATTEFLYYGVGHSDFTAAPPKDGLDFAFTGDNGSSRDRRLFKAGVEVKDLSLYTAGTQNQAGFYNDCLDTVSTGPGSYARPGLQWLKVTAEVTDTGVLYKVGNVNKKDTVWAYFPKDVLPADGNVIIGYYDMFSSVSTDDVFLLVDNIVVTKESAAGVDKYKAENPVAMYPNPAKDILNVVVKKPSTFELFNMAGQLVKKQNIEGAATVKVSDLNRGFYIAKIVDKNGFVQTKKLIIR
jgi:hypothetical protein